MRINSTKRAIIVFQNLPRIKKVLELRRSNAAQPIPSKKIYKRKSKHKKRFVE
jgi:hypothetical protein